jgi:hypothetical protein
VGALALSDCECVLRREIRRSRAAERVGAGKHGEHSLGEAEAASHPSGSCGRCTVGARQGGGGSGGRCREAGE